MHGIRRVLVFCTLTTILPTMLLVIPLYLRHSFYANVAYAVTESDIMEINDGISTIFCSEHTLQMNTSFNAFQMAHRPEITSYNKHIRLKKSMNLPDDTLEYWGFYLLKGASVALSVCSRFQGASILVVKGERNLRTCGMLEHNNNKGHATGIFLPEADPQVKITYETTGQEANSSSTVSNTPNHAILPKPGQDNEHDAENDLELENLNEEYLTYTTTTTTTDATPEQNSAGMNEEQMEALFKTAETYVLKHMELEKSKKQNITRKLRHAKRRIHRVQLEKLRKEKEKEMYEDRLKDLLRQENNTHKINPNKDERNNVFTKRHAQSIRALREELDPTIDRENTNEEWDTEKNGKMSLNSRVKRNQDQVMSPALLDQGIKHGGNADRNVTNSDEASSVSSFESGLLSCYEGSILLAHEFEPSDQCVNVSYLINGKHMQTIHNVIEDGYYYYIFYSDNDIVSNDIHALFDIYKPTFQYENVTKSCINQTECSFALNMMSADRVIVEIPTKDGIDHEKDEMNLLISICHPRMGMYMIFPIAVLFLVLSCAFM